MHDDVKLIISARRSHSGTYNKRQREIFNLIASTSVRSNTIPQFLDKSL
jgi:hypothetical protein